MSSVYTILKCHDPGIQYERHSKAQGGLEPALVIYGLKGAP
jgi:hypothetical protein